MQSVLGAGQVMSLRSLQQAIHVPVAWKDTQQDIICSLTSTQKGQNTHTRVSRKYNVHVVDSKKQDWQQP